MGSPCGSRFWLGEGVAYVLERPRIVVYRHDPMPLQRGLRVVGQAFRCHAHSGVRHGNRHPDILTFGGYPDGRSPWRILAGVGEEVVEHLEDAPSVSHDVGQVCR